MPIYGPTGLPHKMSIHSLQVLIRFWLPMPMGVRPALLTRCINRKPLLLLLSYKTSIVIAKILEPLTYPLTEEPLLTPTFGTMLPQHKTLTTSLRGPIPLPSQMLTIV